jgi:D-alanyl-D-alanine carboxypeptidase
MPVFAIILWTTSCTLDVPTSVESPPETWDPTLNTHPDGPELQALLNQYVREGLPGVVLFVRTPQGLWNGAAGYAHIETSEPMLPTHLHHAESITKMYTATAVMFLVEDGLIDLDGKISQYLPEAIYKDIPNGDKASVRHLLGHTSGIKDFSSNMAYDLDFFNDPKGSYSSEKLLSYLREQEPFCDPGISYFYSNANYYLLAMIMDHVAEKGHASVISERILQRLDLNSTYYKNEPGYPAPPGLVSSYEDILGDGRLMNLSDLKMHSVGEFMGNAGIIATSADFAAFIEELLGGQLVSQESLADMQTWREYVNYGLGLNFIQTAYGPGIGHSGGGTGVQSRVRHFPDVDATLVLLVNAGNNGDMGDLFENLWDKAMETALDNL